ncbi:hypothetical protein HY251_16910 [bacterium]|nr:hypothetical protein [bacterium]
MSPRARKIAAKLVVSVLVVSALASIAGGTLLVLERRGLVTLRRMPHISAFCWYEDRSGATVGVAVVNTDVVGGAFVFSDARNERLRIWIPPRSVLLRHAGWRPVSLWHTGDLIVDELWNGPEPEIVRRGTSIPIAIDRDQMNSGDFYGLYLRDSPTFALIEGAHVIRLDNDERKAFLARLVRTGRMPSGDFGWAPDVQRSCGYGPCHGGDFAIFDDPEGPMQVPIDTTQAEAGFHEVELYVHVYGSRAKPGHQDARYWKRVVIYDPDMTIIDERGSQH